MKGVDKKLSQKAVTELQTKHATEHQQIREEREKLGKMIQEIEERKVLQLLPP